MRQYVKKETVRLFGWTTFEEGESPIRALLFGALADKAWPVVDHYRSDLFHDALWLQAHVNGPTVFYFAVRDYGTHIGTDESLVLDSVGAVFPGALAYRVTLRSDGDLTADETWRQRGLWFADFEQVITE